MTNPTPSDARALVAAARAQVAQGPLPIARREAAHDPFYAAAPTLITQLADALDAATERAEAQGVVVEAARLLIDTVAEFKPDSVAVTTATANLAAALATLPAHPEGT